MSEKSGKEKKKADWWEGVSLDALSAFLAFSAGVCLGSLVTMILIGP